MDEYAVTDCDVIAYFGKVLIGTGYTLEEVDMPILLGTVGQWWGTDSKTRKEVQIDIVGTPVEGNEYLIGSCKYRNEKIGIDELELIQQYASVFRKDGVFHYFIFSKGGFTPALIEVGERGDVTLLTLDDLYQ